MGEPLMNVPLKPSNCPLIANFSSGPCAKRPGWSFDALQGALLGRSHRSKPGKLQLKEVIDRSKQLLGLPPDYRIGIVPASDTGAIEMAMWSLLGERGVDVLAWESFGSQWVTDITKQLKLADVRVFEADYGKLPELSQVDCDRDVIFTWNGTTSGVRVADASWIAADRAGLTLCDATSAVFAYPMDWTKLDVTTYSWQKVLGGEAQHGMVILSPRAVARLESYTPPRPLPKLFRMTKSGKLIDGIFQGETINTPSMLAVADALDGLRWAESIGGLQAMIARTAANFATLAQWVEATPWVEFLAEVPATRSFTSVCLKIADPWFVALARDQQATVAKRVASLLEEEGAAYDIGAYRDAPPGLRIWAGATVEQSDLKALLPWLDWAYATVKSHVSQS
jgi:phosphoserine aminotransferase